MIRGYVGISLCRPGVIYFETCGLLFMYVVITLSNIVRLLFVWWINMHLTVGWCGYFQCEQLYWRAHLSHVIWLFLFLWRLRRMF
jgi:hypothetical protein